MKKTIICTIGGALAALALSGAAHAATISFADEANGNERGVADGTVIADIQGSGVDVKLSANGTNSAYLDGPSNGLDGGLGVCSVLNASAQCTPSSDDNVGSGQAVFVQFSALGEDPSAGTIGSAVFRNANHGTTFDQLSTFAYSLNGGADWITAALTSAFDFSSSAFTSAGLGFKWTNTEFYVSALTGGGSGGTFVSSVPLPAGGLLLLTAFGGLAFARRRKNVA